MSAFAFSNPLPTLLAAAFMLASLNCAAAGNRCAPHRGSASLVSGSVFDGPPQESVELMPDDLRPSASALDSTWDVAAIYAAGRKVYLVCRYSGSRRPVTVKIKGKVKRCALRTHAGRPPELGCR